MTTSNRSMCVKQGALLGGKCLRFVETTVKWLYIFATDASVCLLAFLTAFMTVRLQYCDQTGCAVTAQRPRRTHIAEQIVKFACEKLQYIRTHMCMNIYM